MLDDLREQASAGYPEDDEEMEEETPAYFRMRYQSDTPFLGMTPGQRFILALMLLLMTLFLGISILLVSGTIIPFF